MITASIESFTERVVEIKLLIDEHYRELALDQDRVPLDPAWDVYFERERQGQVVFVSLRKDGEMIGYFIGFVAPGLHYRTCLTFSMDIFYISRAERGGIGALKLMRALIRELQRRGVHRAFLGSKDHVPSERLFRAFGAKKIETYYSLWLGK